jgi:hypothetical protein
MTQEQEFNETEADIAKMGYDNDSCEKGPFGPLLPVMLAIVLCA